MKTRVGILRMRRLVQAALAAGLGLALVLPAVPPAFAAGITVNTFDDELNNDGDCSLREALRAANTNTLVDHCPAGGATDTITLPAGTYPLDLIGTGEDAGLTGDLDLTSNLKIVGAGASSTFIDGQTNDRLVDVLAGASVTLSKLALQHGFAPDGGAVRNAGTLILTGVDLWDNQAGVLCAGGGPANCQAAPTGRGGGIFNTGTLTLNGLTKLSGNRIDPCCGPAQSGPRQGAGIYNAGTLVMNQAILSYSVVYNTQGPAETSGGGLYNIGNAQISRSVIYANGVQNCCGGGIYNGGTLKLTNVTLSQNSSVGPGAGLYNQSTAILNNVTIALNKVDFYHVCSPACLGGGLNNAAGSLYLTNSIIANNSGSGPDCAGTIISQGYNLIRNTNRCTITGNTTGNRYGQDPLLTPLRLTAAPMPYHYLKAGSPAIDTANPAAPGSGGNACPQLDQIGVNRLRDGNGDGVARCDIGAIEH